MCTKQKSKLCIFAVMIMIYSSILFLLYLLYSNISSSLEDYLLHTVTPSGLSDCKYEPAYSVSQTGVIIGD